VRRNQTAVRDVLRAALGPKLSKRIYSIDFVATRWESAVGEELAKRAEPESLADGLLTVRVSDPVWGRTILKLQGKIVPRLNQALGQNLVRRIVFTRREGVGNGKELRALPEPKREAVAPESVVRAAGSISDPEMRAMVTRIAARYFEAQTERRRK
jgi:predicted nucleic acid-binding Zn ribbon protein